MIEALWRALAPTGWPTVILLTARVVGVMLLAPMWSMSAVVPRIRVALGIAITFALLPTVAPVSLPDQALALPALIGLEFVFGLTIGLTAALFLHAVVVAGEVVSVQMGLAIAAALAPSADFASPGLGALKNLMGLGFYFALGGHLLLLAGLADSVRVIPPGVGADFASGTHAFTMLFGTVFGSAVRVAAPLMAAMMLANTVLGVLSKAVPQINTMMVAFPITIGLGLIVFGASIPVLALLMRDWVAGLGGDLQRAIDAFMPTPTVAPVSP